MNLLERKMVDRLHELKNNYHAVAVKAEFEAEGTRMEEAMRLKEISMKAGLPLALKIGGCEALKDMFEAASLGAKYLVAPMVESPYALRKYLRACKVAFPSDLRSEMEFYVNIETKSACEKFDEMLTVPEIQDLTGVVIGRHDLAESLDLALDAVNGSRIFELTSAVARKAKQKSLKVVIGGAVSVDAKPFFHALPLGDLDKFETRKIVFGCPGALSNPDEAFLRAVEFEIDWLKNKQLYYGAIHRESEDRLAIMEDRYRRAIQSISANDTPATN